VKLRKEVREDAQNDASGTEREEVEHRREETKASAEELACINHDDGLESEVM